MVRCKKCQGGNIKSRTNYPFGRKSKSVTSYSCKDCGSTEMETNTNNFNRRSRPKRGR